MQTNHQQYRVEIGTQKTCFGILLSLNTRNPYEIYAELPDHVKRDVTAVCDGICRICSIGRDAGRLQTVPKSQQPGRAKYTLSSPSLRKCLPAGRTLCPKTKKKGEIFMMNPLPRLLIAVDLQNDFVTGTLGFPEALSAVQAATRRIALYRQEGDVVVFTMDTHKEDYPSTQEGRMLPVPHCIKGTTGWKLTDAIEALRKESDSVFQKGAFGSDELFSYLKEHPFRSIELVGLVSNICVLSCAVLAKTAQPETPVYLCHDCTAGPDPALHEAALRVLEGIQVHILSAGAPLPE